MNNARIDQIAGRLMEAYDQAHSIDPITASEPGFDVAAGYAVLHEIQKRRVASGWRPVGRKIGFTNQTIWARYGVDRPMWAYVYDRTVHFAPRRKVALSASGFVEPRIEPEVVFGLRAPVPVGGDSRSALEAVDWIAAGFEIVQSHFPGWKFQVADCTAAFGLHGALVVGPATALDDTLRDRLARVLPTFEVTLARDGTILDRGRGSNVLGSPALALQHLANLLAEQPQFQPLARGEVVTTGTLTDAWPIAAGARWHADYGALGLPGIELAIE